MPDFDVCVIGGGVVGCAIARELSHYKLSAALVEAANDVGTGTSKANTLGPGVTAGILVPGESIICPLTPVLAYATEAIENGLELFLENQVTAIELEADRSTVVTNRHRITARWIINAAGLYADAIDAMIGTPAFSVTPRRGQLIVFDRLARALISHIILPIPTERTKGVLVSPTVFGNILLGPTAEDLEDKQATVTTREGLDGLLQQGRAIVPRLLEEEVTATYAGLRPATEEKDYRIRIEEDKRYICVGGIRSTGLSASLGIAEYVAGLLQEAGEGSTRKTTAGSVAMPPLGEAQIRPAFDDDRISPAYGRIVCLCERVSEGEIVDALNAPLPAPDTNGLRRRTRCLQGRCQGFHCSGEIAALMRRHQPSPLPKTA